jgi:hypothetical protein
MSVCESMWFVPVLMRMPTFGRDSKRTIFQGSLSTSDHPFPGMVCPNGLGVTGCDSLCCEFNTVTLSINNTDWFVANSFDSANILIVIYLYQYVLECLQLGLNPMKHKCVCTFVSKQLPWGIKLSRPAVFKSLVGWWLVRDFMGLLTINIWRFFYGYDI